MKLSYALLAAFIFATPAMPTPVNESFTISGTSSGPIAEPSFSFELSFDPALGNVGPEFVSGFSVTGFGVSVEPSFVYNQMFDAIYVGTSVSQFGFILSGDTPGVIVGIADPTTTPVALLFSYTDPDFPGFPPDNIFDVGALNLTVT